MKDTLARVLGALAILVGIATLVALYFVWSLAMENKSVFTDMLNGYDERISALEAPSAMEEDEEDEAADTRPLMPEDYFGTLPPNTDPATTEVEYRNAEIGLAFQVPYNPDWGNRAYRVAPYVERQTPDADGVLRTGVQFGPSFPFEGGGWARGLLLTAEDAVSAEDAITRIRDLHGDFLQDREIETVEIDGKTVVVYYAGGLCEYVSLTVIGEKANYNLWPICGDSADARNELVEIVRTMEFIN